MSDDTTMDPVHEEVAADEGTEEQTHATPAAEETETV